jgi:uncharacterized membrane protein
MDILDILALSNDRFAGFHSLWSFYITVSVGILAYVAATFSTASSLLVRVLLIIAFIMFAGVNLFALTDVREQRDVLADIALEKLPNQYSEKIETIDKFEVEKIKIFINDSRPVSKYKLVSFHFILDVLTIFIIWYIPGALVRMKKINTLNKSPISPKSSRYTLPAVISRDEEKQEWILENNFKVETADYLFNIPKGFNFDLASIPRLLWFLIAPFELSIAAPLVHDYLYRVGGNLQPNIVSHKMNDVLKPILTMNKDEVDQIFLEMMKDEGISNWRRKCAYLAVRIFGELSWRKT